MADCPYCDDWRYRPLDAPVTARLAHNSWPPLVWDGEKLRQAWLHEAPDGARLALATHICEVHWMEPEVVVLGPVVQRAGISPP